MPRPTKAEIDAEIIDCAAGLFARQGFARTSIQQIADALNYSKAGLLHHYASKQALYDAILDKFDAQMKERIAEILTFPVGIARDRAFAEGAVAFAFDWPGISALGERLALEGPVEDPRLIGEGPALLAAMSIDMDTPDLERLLRVFGAFAGVSQATRIAKKMNRERELRPVIIATAMNALGHFPPRKPRTAAT